jgi:hypothetical protein
MKLGDKVRFLNDVGGGIVKGFKSGGIALVEDEDGFEIPCLQDDLVVIDTNEYNFEKPKPKDTPKENQYVDGRGYLASKDVNNKMDSDEVDENLEARVVRLEMRIHKLEERLARLEDAKAIKEKEKLAAKQMRKQQKDEILEIDLHAHEILETTKGMQARDIKDYQVGVFTRTMNEHIKEKGKKIVFIHGKGEGALRKAIIDTLKDKYKSCEYQDASFQQYGFGATLVIIH